MWFAVVLLEVVVWTVCCNVGAGGCGDARGDCSFV